MKNQAYISAPYSADNYAEIMEHVLASLEIGIDALKLGYAPIIPHVCQNHNTSWEGAMKHDLEILKTLCPLTDIVILAPGWEKSHGCVIEKQEADKRGIRAIPYYDLIGGTF